MDDVKENFGRAYASYIPELCLAKIVNFLQINAMADALLVGWLHC